MTLYFICLKSSVAIWVWVTWSEISDSTDSRCVLWLCSFTWTSKSILFTPFSFTDVSGCWNQIQSSSCEGPWWISEPSGWYYVTPHENRIMRISLITCCWDSSSAFHFNTDVMVCALPSPHNNHSWDTKWLFQSVLWSEFVQHQFDHPVISLQPMLTWRLYYHSKCITCLSIIFILMMMMMMSISSLQRLIALEENNIYRRMMRNASKCWKIKYFYRIEIFPLNLNSFYNIDHYSSRWYFWQCTL